MWRTFGTKHNKTQSHTTATVLLMYLRSCCRDQSYCGHVCAAYSLDFLNVTVTVFIHQLERIKNNYINSE